MLVARAFMKVARAAWGDGLAPNWQQMDLLPKAAYMMVFSFRLLVAKIFLELADMTADFAGWLIGIDGDDENRDRR